MNPSLVVVIVVVVVAFLFFAIAKVVGVHRRRQSAERKEITISVLPKTSLGIWLVGLIISFILVLFLIGVLTGSGMFVFKIIWVGVPAAILVIGLTSMIRKRERSVVVLVSMVVGLWLLIGGVWHLLGGD